jgi:hypothetical protein
MRLPLVAGLVVALALLGCGGGNDEDQAKQSVEQFFTALEKKDSGKLCNDLLTKDFLEQITGATGDRAVSECKSQFKQLQATNIRLGRVDSVKVDGDTATVRATIERSGQSQPQVFRLKKEDGDWRLENPGA